MAKTQTTQVNPVWPRPTLPPLPRTTVGVRSPVISLNGTWKINVRPPDRFWTDSIDPASWTDTDVPGYTVTQGLEIEENQEYAYRKRITIPSDFAGKRILLRLDGVTGLARLWVNGEYVREHYGGFTSWYADITDHVTPGQEAWLALGVTDKPREISVFNLGGIIRDVRLVALPQDRVTRLHVETELDAGYRDATLKVTAAVAFQQGDHATVTLALKDPQSKTVSLRPNVVNLTREQPEGTIEIPVTAPARWDAEHPNLYTLEASLAVGGATVETLSKAIGFRKIEKAGNKLYVNGQEVKLRGVNRHDIHPKTGRAINPELVEQDARLFRGANVNFIRTSHYPPREDFLDACDRYGIYIEDEIAVAFVYQSIQPTQNDPDFTAGYMEQFAEMIERDRSHACVIMWSLANESFWGSNFQKEYDYAKAEDTTRPVIFSYPITMPQGTRAYDIWSLHYASWDCDPSSKADNFSIGESWGHDAPVLHDEYAHGPCYDLPEQVRDPAVRDFWGESIKRFWESIFTTDGALGGAIWGGIDDVMITPHGYTQWEWGIYDGWRRKKPEYWLTKKGYSPIRIECKSLPNPGQGKPLSVPIKNWFDHTNLNEISIQWSVGQESGTTSGPDVQPHAEGILQVPARGWTDGEVVNLQLHRGQDLVVDEFNLVVGSLDKSFPGPQGPAPKVREDAESIAISGADFSITFNRKTGLITKGTYKGSDILTGGPYLNLVGIQLPQWSLKGISTESRGNEAVVHISGSYGPIQVRFEVRIDGKGLMTTTYTIDDLPVDPPRARRLRVGVDVGGYREVGVAYTLSSGVDRLTWERDGLWSAYPADHIGRNKGLAHRVRPGGVEGYGVPPSWPWAEDMKEFALFGKYDIGGRGTKDFRSMKHNIWYASAVVSGTENRARAESDGTDAVRLEVLDRPNAKVDCRDPRVKYVGTWIPADVDNRSYHGTEMYSNKAGDYVEFTFQGTGVCWIAAKDMIYGKADVYVDGSKEASEIDLHCGMGHGSSRGEEKIYQEVLFSKEGLKQGTHTIKVVVTGKKAPASNNTFVSVDAFEVLGTPGEGEVRLIINNLWNYPELTWGNYMKEPILIETGYTDTVRMRLTDNDR